MKNRLFQLAVEIIRVGGSGMRSPWLKSVTTLLQWDAFKPSTFRLSGERFTTRRDTKDCCL